MRPLPLDALRQASAEALAAAFAGPPEKAARWIDAAARYGMVEAQLLLGQILLDGRGMPQDMAAARGWFRVAAEAGSLAARNMLGRCHELGWGGAVDEALALACYCVAAEAGHDWAQYNLAGMLWRGAGTAADRRAGLAWYRRAAEQGHAKALNILGRFLEEGWEAPADPVAAAKLYRRAAEGGDFRGQFNLATLLAAAGEVEEALGWFRRAAVGSPARFRNGMAARLAGRPEAAFRALAAELGASPRHGRS